MKQQLFKTIILLLFTSYTFGQTITRTIDTISIYKNKTGIRYKVYEKIWFRNDNKYSWANRKENKQDRLVLQTDTTSYYFRVYDKKNRLLLEGQKNGIYGWLQGKIIFYYKNGKVKRIEYRDIDNMDMCHIYDFKNKNELDSSYTWKYYRSDGTIKMQKVYFIKELPENGMDSAYKYEAIPQTTEYKRNGNVKSVKLRGQTK